MGVWLAGSANDRVHGPHLLGLLANLLDSSGTETASLMPHRGHPWHTGSKHALEMDKGQSTSCLAASMRITLGGFWRSEKGALVRASPQQPQQLQGLQPAGWLRRGYDDYLLWVGLRHRQGPVVQLGQSLGTGN